MSIFKESWHDIGRTLSWGFCLILFTLPYSEGHPFHKEGLTCMAISSDSTLALTGSKDGSIAVVNITTGKVNVSAA